jgi:flagellar hook protein FlgE
MTRSGGEVLYTRAGSFSVDANGTLTSSTGEPVQGWTGVNGVVNAAGNPGDIRIPLGNTVPPKATANINLKGNLSSDSIPDPNNAANAGIGYNTDIPIKVFDAQGESHTVTAKFTRTALAPSTQWDVTLTDDTGTTTAAVPLTFTNGKPDMTSLTLGPYTADVSDITSYSGITDARVFQTDGQTAGSLTSLAFTVSETGQVVGVYNNGMKQVLAQVSMATFANPEGLEKVGNSMYRSTVNSGYAQIGTPGSAGMGDVISGALEMSNVDLAQEFTNLVVAQRGFQANSKIITTSDELLQELVSMKR